MNEQGGESEKAFKKPSGHARRKAAREALDARLASETGGSEVFKEIGPAPVDDPTMAMEWVRRVQLRALEQVACSEHLPERERWRLIESLSKALGMTHSRSAVEERMRRIEEQRKEKGRASSVRIEPAANVAKPPTARGANEDHGE